MLGEDAVTGNAEQSRQEGDRDEHGDGDHDRCGVAERGDERDPGELQAEDRHHDRATGHDHGLTCGRVGAADRLVDVHPVCEVIAVAAQHEQRIVDADSEADHRAESRCDRGDVDQPAQQSDDRQPGRQPGNCDAQRHHGGDDGPEGDEEHDQCGKHADHLGGTLGTFLQHGREFAAELDLHPGLLRGRGGVEQFVQRGAAEIGGRAVELHGRERGRAVG
jgi:hypothetical protein